LALAFLPISFLHFDLHLHLYFSSREGFLDSFPEYHLLSFDELSSRLVILMYGNLVTTIASTIRDVKAAALVLQAEDADDGTVLH
jgi:hypothetical protein